METAPATSGIALPFRPTYNIPGMKSPGQMLQGWALSGIVVLQSGLPWSPSDSSVDWLGTGESANSAPQYWNYSGPPSAFNVTSSPDSLFRQVFGLHTLPCGGWRASTSGGLRQRCDGSVRRSDYHRWPIGARCAHQYRLLRTGRGVLTPPAYGTLGDAGRGIFRGQNYYNVDFSVSKIWKLRERYQRPVPRGVLQSSSTAPISQVPPQRAERQSWPPAPNSGVGGGFGYATVTPDAGNSVLGSGGPRHVQFGLKLTF